MLLITIIFLNAMLLELKLSILLRIVGFVLIFVEKGIPMRTAKNALTRNCVCGFFIVTGGVKIHPSMYYSSRSDPVTYNP